MYRLAVQTPGLGWRYQSSRAPLPEWRSARCQCRSKLGLAYLDQQAVYSGRWVGIFAGMTLTMVPVLIIFFFLQRQITRGLTVGALKG